MPNWCSNRLVISGERETLMEVERRLQGESCLDFNKLIPYPEEYELLDRLFEVWRSMAEKASATGSEELAAKASLLRALLPENDGYNSGGYDWCIQNWGTKWNAVKARKRLDETLTYTFLTAWSPPVPFIRELSRQYPTLALSLTWRVEGGAKGKIIFRSGVPY